MSIDFTYVLIHSPLVGPLTWQLVKAEMEKRGLDAITPTLSDHPDSAQPYWQQHAKSLASGLIQTPGDRDLVLVAHSGAGPLLPVMRRALTQSVAAYVFVDAGIPCDNLSRLDLMRLQDSHWAEEFHQTLLHGETFPQWNAEDLREIIPDENLRQKMAAEINPRALAFFTEPIPVFAGWPDSPCAYLKFSAAYDWDFDQAGRANWAMREMNAGHFHMLVDPSAVTSLIIEMVQDLQSPS